MLIEKQRYHDLNKKNTHLYIHPTIPKYVVVYLSLPSLEMHYQLSHMKRYIENFKNKKKCKSMMMMKEKKNTK